MNQGQSDLSKRVANSLIEMPVQESALSRATAAEYETISGLLGVLRRRWAVIVLVAAVTILLGTAACMLITPRYSATVTIEVNQEDRGSSNASHNEANADTIDTLKPEVQTDMSIIQSDGLALRVLDELHLKDKRPFSKAIVRDEAGKSLDEAPRSRERMLKLFRKSLKVEAPQDTRLINITFENPDPAIAALTANSLARSFIEDYLERRHESTSQASYWLKKELVDLKKQVQESEQRLADYERKTGMAGVQISGSTSGDGSSSVAVSSHNTVLDRLFALNQELTSAEANRISSEAVYQLVKTQNPEVVLGLGAMSIANGNGGQSGALMADGGMDLLRSLRAQDAGLRREYASYAAKYGEKNPRLIQLHEQIDAVDTQMKAELSRITKRAENALQYSRASENSIKEKFEKQQVSANVLADDTVQLEVLAQEAFSNRALYQNLFSKLQEASLSSGVRATRIDVVNNAREPATPSSPDYSKYLTLIAGVGIFLGVCSAFVRESLDQSVRTARHIEAISSLSILAYVPSKTATKTLPESPAGGSALIADPTSPFAEAFRMLRTSVLLSAGSERPKTVLVTSPLGNDGKTTIVYNLGIAFAQQGARVLLIDADLRNSDLHRVFGCQRTQGLSDLSGVYPGDQVDGIVPHAHLKNLYLLPSGIRSRLPSEFFTSETFDTVLANCRSRFDYVVIDSPPILPVTDSSILATKVDGTVVVLRSRTTTRSMVSGVVQTLARTGAPVLGFVFNGVANPALDGFYSYGYLRGVEEEAYANI